jgi:hypothetical protein
LQEAKIIRTFAVGKWLSWIAMENTMKDLPIKNIV